MWASIPARFPWQVRRRELFLRARRLGGVFVGHFLVGRRLHALCLGFHDFIQQFGGNRESLLGRNRAAACPGGRFRRSRRLFFGGLRRSGTAGAMHLAVGHVIQFLDKLAIVAFRLRPRLLQFAEQISDRVDTAKNQGYRFGCDVKLAISELAQNVFARVRDGFQTRGDQETRRCP